MQQPPTGYGQSPQWNGQPQQGFGQQPYGQPPPQPPKKKSTLLLIVGIIVVLIFFACAGASALAYYGNNQNASTTTNSSSLNSNTTADTTSTAVPTNKHYNQTDAVQVGNIFDIEIVSVKTSTGSQIFQPKAGDVYLVFLIKMKNISSQEQAVSSLLSFTLLDTNGQKYHETIDPDAGATLDGKIEPGSLLQGSVVYEVPSSVKNFTLAFEAVLILPGQVIWNINV